MTNVAQTPRGAKRSHTLAAKYAILYAGTTDYVGQCGIALRQEDGTCWFRSEATGTWLPLVDADLPRLQFMGAVDLVAAQALRDGEPVVTASRTLQGAA